MKTFYYHFTHGTNRKQCPCSVIEDLALIKIQLGKSIPYILLFLRHDFERAGWPNRVTSTKVFSWANDQDSSLLKGRFDKRNFEQHLLFRLFYLIKIFCHFIGRSVEQATLEDLIARGVILPMHFVIESAYRICIMNEQLPCLLPLWSLLIFYI